MMGRRQEAARRLLLADPPSPARLDKNLQQQQQAFDSSMGLTVLALLTALFFMGFFSVYIRRFAHDSPVDLSRRRRSPGSSSSPYSSSYSLGNNAARFCTHKGLDLAAIQSLPVLTYTGPGFAKHPAVVDCCAVCLTEFGEGECVKMLPPCRHFFHPECIDTWLLSRASCPVCRASRLFVEPKQDEQAARGGEVTAEGVGGDGMRRCCSCSNLLVNERGGLQRTRSF